MDAMELRVVIHTFNKETNKQGGEALRTMSLSVDPIRGCTCTMSLVQRPMFVYCLTWGSWRRSVGGGQTLWSLAGCQSIGDYERMDDQTSAEVLSDKKGDRRDVEIANLFESAENEAAAGHQGCMWAAKSSHIPKKHRI
jgi:hypothetical protein